MPKKITLDDIADATHLSKYAVSRAISGKPGISRETRQKVLDCCKTLGYKRRQTPDNGQDGYRVVLLFIPRSDAQDATFWMDVLQGVESEASKSGYALQLKFVDSGFDVPSNEMERASGIIYAGYKSIDVMMRYRYLEKPALLMTYPPEKLLSMDTIHMADEEAGYSIVDKIFEWGHRIIGFWGDMERPSSRHRFDGVLRAVQEYDIEISQIWNDEKYQNTEVLENELKELHVKNKLPTAILCSHDKLALELIQILNQMGLSVPGDVSVTGFNADTMEKSPIAVTSMGYSKIAYGKLAFQYLKKRILNPDLPYQRISVVPKLLLKGSAGPVSGSKQGPIPDGLPFRPSCGDAGRGPGPDS
ncbi:MAG: LacI family transcriptional regulator [Treponema sp.]|jgi:LacI family transcriptional regulator|nr:LacI family transcriptional regulator [Treponema sp.]